MANIWICEKLGHIRWIFWLQKSGRFAACNAEVLMKVLHGESESDAGSGQQMKSFPMGKRGNMSFSMVAF